MRLCERGVLSDRQFISWRYATGRWDPDRDAVTIYGRDQSGTKVHFDMLVPAAQLAKVEALLTDKLPKYAAEFAELETS